MKTKAIIAIFICALLLCFMLGATNVVKLADASMAGENTAAKDRLVGVFITKEYLDLFDFDGYINDHGKQILSGGEISESESAAYEGRIYATLTEKPYTSQDTGETTMMKEYAFEGVEGIGYYCAMITDKDGSYHGSGSSGDDAISDGHIAINSTDAGDGISLEGTIYVSVTDGPTEFYYNPVYQTAQGEVYIMAGQGMSYGGEITAGMSGSHELKDEITTTVGGETETVSSSIKMTVCYMDRPTGISVVQLDGDDNVLTRTEYAGGTLPATLATEPGTKYIIVETQGIGADRTAVTTRKLFQPEDESLYAFFCREDGICVQQYCEIEWN